MRALIDRYLPTAARSWRQVRDWRRYQSAKPYKTAFGFQLYGDANLDTSRQDTEEIDTVRDVLAAGAVLVDVGANVGLFSCFANTMGQPAIAIEPQPHNVQLLCRNVHLNRLSNVEILPVALSDNIGVLPLFGGGQGASLRQGWGG
jgi:hypothetical protein